MPCFFRLAAAGFLTALTLLTVLGPTAALGEGRSRTGVPAQSGPGGADHRGSGHHGGYHHGGHHGGRTYYRSPWYGGYGWYGSTYPFYGPWWWAWGPAAYALGPEWDPTHGALDLDISPERARVYVNGEFVGVADNFDGFPRFLWLRDGDYRLVFHLEGYRTVVHEYTVRPGEVRELDFRLEPGETTPPEELFEKKGRPGGQEQAEARPEPEPERARPVARESDPRPGAGPGDARRAPGRLALRVEPLDAAVYLDGRFLGSGEDLARLHAGLLVDPGKHTVEIVRPGYRTKVVPFDVAEGGEAQVDARLERE